MCGTLEDYNAPCGCHGVGRALADGMCSNFEPAESDQNVLFVGPQ